MVGKAKQLESRETNMGKIWQIKLACKVKFTLEQATKVQEGSRGIAILFL